MTQSFQISLFRHKRDTNAQLVERTWEQLCANFREPQVRAEKDGPLFSPAVFDPPVRAKLNVKRLSLLVLDLDHAAKLGTIKSRLSLLECAFIISSTHSHLRQTESNPSAEPRFRVVVPLAEPIPAARFLSLWSYVKQMTHLNVDEAAKDESRIFYTPAISSESSEYECFIQEGSFLDWKRLPLTEAIPRGSRMKTAPSYESVTAGVPIANGSRNQGLFKIGKRLAEAHLSEAAIRAALLVENDRLCDSPLSADEVKSIAANARRYPIQLNEAPEDNALPIPLPDNKVQTPQLDERLLPEVWKPWLSDVCERLQCPLDYAVVAAMVSAASLIGNRIRVRPKQHDPWMVVPNLWGAIIGPPGVMKSPAFKEGLIFFNEIANRERAEFAREQEDSAFEKEFNESKRSDLIKEMKKAPIEKKADLRLRFDSLKAEEPVEKRLWTADATVEKLGELLNENPDGILMNRDELTGWLKQLDRQGHEQDRAFYLEAWNGEGNFTFDRIGRGTTHIKNVTISILGTIQPSMIEPYFRSAMNGLGDDGLIQRFQLLVYPEVPKAFKYLDRPPKGRDPARDSFKYLYEMTPKDIDAKFLTSEAGGHAFLQFNDEAQEFFVEWVVDLETDLRSDTIESSALISHISKYRSLMPSLSLIFHLLKRVNKETDSHSIGLASVELAAAWCSYLKMHAEKLYTLASVSRFDCAREILKRIESGELGSPFTARDVYAKHWKRLSEPEEVKRSLEILSEYRYLQPMRFETAGRTKTLYTVHESIGAK